MDLAGRPATVAVVGPGRWTLLVFVSSGCDGCREFIGAAGDPVASGLVTDEAVVVVTRDPAEEDRGALSRLMAPGAPVVMSSAAWSAYRVLGRRSSCWPTGATPGGDRGRGLGRRPGGRAPEGGPFGLGRPRGAPPAAARRAGRPMMDSQLLSSTRPGAGSST